MLTNLRAAIQLMQANQKGPFSSEDFLMPQTGLLRVSVAEQMRWVWGNFELLNFEFLNLTFLKSQQMVLLIVVLVIENVRLRACTKTWTILTNTIQFLFESYPILM